MWGLWDIWVGFKLLFDSGFWLEFDLDFKNFIWIQIVIWSTGLKIDGWDWLRIWSLFGKRKHYIFAILFKNFWGLSSQLKQNKLKRDFERIIMIEAWGVCGISDWISMLTSTSSLLHVHYLGIVVISGCL